MNASRLPIQVTNRDKGPSPTVNQPETPSLAEITKPKVDLEIKKVSHKTLESQDQEIIKMFMVFGVNGGDILEIYNMVIYPSMKVMRSVRQIVRNVQNVRNCPAHIRYVRIIIRYNIGSISLARIGYT